MHVAARKYNVQFDSSTNENTPNEDTQNAIDISLRNCIIIAGAKWKYYMNMHIYV